MSQNPDYRKPAELLAASLLAIQGRDHSADCLATTCPVAAELREVADNTLAANPDLIVTTVEGLAAALHECYCHRNLSMHSAADHSARAIAKQIKEATHDRAPHG